MATRAKRGIVKPKTIFDLHVEGLSPIPKTYRGALKDPNWHSAMVEEYGALLSNNTWDLVDPPRKANIVTGKWIYRHKMKSDGSLERYKACWVLSGSTITKCQTYKTIFAFTTRCKRMKSKERKIIQRMS
jgi:hypothetical protein